MSSSAGAFPRKLIKERRREFLQLAWWRLGAIVLGAVVLSIAGSMALGAVTISVWVAIPVAVAAILWVLLPQLDGTYHLESGREAEQWTARELSRAFGRRAPIINHLLLEFRDIDHVAVSGRGVFVVETKYTDSVKRFSSRHRQEATDWANETYDRARTIRLFLKSQLRTPIPVTPLVVVWGGHVEELPVNVDGVHAVHGRDLRTFLRSSSNDLPRGLQDRSAKLLHDVATMRSHREQKLGSGQA